VRAEARDLLGGVVRRLATAGSGVRALHLQVVAGWLEQLVDGQRRVSDGRRVLDAATAFADSSSTSSRRAPTIPGT
jgi:hypothetical protein